MTSRVIETKEVKVQAHPVFSGERITSGKIYDAICEVTEYTYTNRASAASGQSWETKTISIDNIYVVVDNNGKILRSGDEFFRQVS